MAGAPTSLARAGERAGLWVEALARASGRPFQEDWFAAPIHAWLLDRPAPQGFVAAPHDPRPSDQAAGEAILGGAMAFGDEILKLDGGAAPWDRASPSRWFAVRLHRFDWMNDLLACGEPGAREALRLVLEWRRVFGRWNSFVWSADILERRVLRLACVGRALAALASDAEGAVLAASLAAQARHLAGLRAEPLREAERLTVVAAAGAALGGQAGEQLMTRALARLPAVLDAAVLADGGHASRSPQAGLELLFDLTLLDDALTQRGRPPPQGLSRAIDRLTAGLRFFTLNDGALACFQGGEAVAPARVAAARAQDDAPEAKPPAEAPHSCYVRMEAASVQVIADAGPPAAAGWSLGACGQPLALEIVCGRDRLITNSGWSLDAAAPGALRLAGAASTASIGDGALGEPLRGFLAASLGPRLIGGVAAVDVKRREAEGSIWVELSHTGWAGRYGLVHQRRLYLNAAENELRGEDRFVPAENAPERSTPVNIHFQLFPGVRASLAHDQRSVLLQGASNLGWWLRNDAVQVSVEPGTHLVDGRPVRASQVIMRGRLRADRGGRVRWKLALAESAP